MGATVQQEGENLRVLRLTGLLKKAEWDAALAREAKQWTSATNVKVLVLAENFQGWERGADWGDLNFLVKHDAQIEKIAIVAEPRWETELITFAGAGFRHAAVKFFSAGEAAAARVWLQ
ncbi:MAG TPA: STAS/SEC14 domain-containing protein [Thermodesulfobacteriota bacterium]|nr:STAS/SEC14 domain-containing protein [Thermodesulfobacteriota bacterium]